MIGIPTIPQYYHQLMARGTEVVADQRWNTASTTDLTITPAAEEAVLVRTLEWVANDVFALGVGDRLDITPWGNQGGTAYLITSFAHLIALSEYTPPSSGATVPLHRGILRFQPFIILRSSSTPVDTFSVEYTGATGIGPTNFLHLVAKGHMVSDSTVGLD